jgi:aminopeptidase N
VTIKVQPFVCAVLLFVSTAVALAQSGGLNPQNNGPLDPLLPWLGNSGYDAQHYQIELRIADDRRSLEGQTTMTAIATQDFNTFSLDFGSLQVSSLKFNGQAVKFMHRDPKLEVDPGRVVARGERFSVSIAYAGVPGARWDVFMSPMLLLFPAWSVGANGDLSVLGQPSVVHQWTPVNESPADKATFGLTLTHKQPATVIANGELVSSSISNGQITNTYRYAQPTTPYMLMFAIGKFELLEAGVINGVRVRHYLSPSTQPALRQTIDRLPEMLQFFESRLGKYPYSELGVFTTANISLFALETQTLISMGLDYGDFNREILAHELVHQWFGAASSYRDLSQTWIHEGFASYLAAIWVSQDTPEAGSLEQKMRQVYDACFACQPPAVIRLGYDAFGSVYTRGAVALYKLHSAVGDQVFWQVLRSFLKRFKYAVVTNQDFVQVVLEVAGPESKSLLEHWLYDERIPNW